MHWKAQVNQEINQKANTHIITQIILLKIFAMEVYVYSLHPSYTNHSITRKAHIIYGKGV
jgi:hypothetical protein